MRKGSKVIKIKYEEDSIFVGAAWGIKRTRWGQKRSQTDPGSYIGLFEKRSWCA